MYFIPIYPVAKGRPRLGKFCTYTPKKTTDSADATKFILKSLKIKPVLEGPVMLKIIFKLKRPKKHLWQFPVTRPDVDNYVKQFLDCGNDILWKDDSQVVHLIAIKDFANQPSEEGTYFELYAVT